MTDTSAVANKSDKKKPWDPLQGETPRKLKKFLADSSKPQHPRRDDRGQTKPGMRRH